MNGPVRAGMSALPGRPRTSRTAVSGSRAQGRRMFLSRRPSAKALMTAAGVVLTAVLMLELGVWYFVALLALYAALDIAQRSEARRAARVHMAVVASIGHRAGTLRFAGTPGDCEAAAWAARNLGWMVSPMQRERFWRRSVRFTHMSGASPLSYLLEALADKGLVRDVDIRQPLPSFGRRLIEHGRWDGAAIEERAPATGGRGLPARAPAVGEAVDRRLRDRPILFPERRTATAPDRLVSRLQHRG